MAEQTFALMRHPGKVTSRQIFDYNTTLGTAVGGGGEYRIAGVCATSGDGCSTHTPEMELIALFGRARGGVRVFRNSSDLGAVWVEAVVVSDGKLVVLLLNRQDTVLPVNLRIGAQMSGSGGWDLLRSAVVLDRVSLRPLAVCATSASGWRADLPPHAVAAVTFTRQNPMAALFVSELVTTEALPDAAHFMLPVAQGSTGLEVSLTGPDVHEAADDGKYVVDYALTIGVRGWLENATLTATVPCTDGTLSHHRWVRPGTIVTTTLDTECTPLFGQAGLRLSLNWTADISSSCASLTRPTPPCPTSGPQGGWWENAGVCLQDCPLGMQGRDSSSGRCLCGNSSPNSSCFNPLNCIGGECCSAQPSSHFVLAILSTTHHAELVA